jgi:hypothetical protein
MNTIEFKLDLLNYINNYKERQYKTLYNNYDNKMSIDNYNDLYIKYKILIIGYEKLRYKYKNEYLFFINNSIKEFKEIHEIQKNNYEQLFFNYKKLQMELSFYNIELTKLNNLNKLNENKKINNKLIRDIKILSIL